MAFCDLFLSLCVMFPGSSIIAFISPSVLFIWILFCYMYIPHFLYPFFCQWAFEFPPFVCYEIVLLWPFMYKYLFEYLFSFFLEYIPRSVNAGSYDNSMFNFPRNCQTVFNRNGIIFSFPPAIYEGYSFSTFLPIVVILAILVSVKWYVIVIFICIFLMINDVGHLFMHF